VRPPDLVIDVKVVDLCISARSGENCRPASGEVTFEDGSRYDWSQYTEETRFHGSRRMAHGGWERFSFRSPARAAALHLALAGNEPGAVVEDYGDRYRRQYQNDQGGEPRAGADDDRPGF